MTHHAGALPRFAVVTIDEISALSSLPKSAIRAILAVRMFADPRAPLDPDSGCRKSVRELAAVAGCPPRTMEKGLAAATEAGWVRCLDAGDPSTGRPASRSVLSPDPPPKRTGAEHPRTEQNGGTPPPKRTGVLKEADPLTDPTASDLRKPREPSVQQPLLSAPKNDATSHETAVCRRIDRALYDARKTALPERACRIGRQVESSSGRRTLRKILERHTADELADAIARFGRRCARDRHYVRDGRHVPLVNLLRIEHFARNDCARVAEYLNDPSLDEQRVDELGAPEFYQPEAEREPDADERQRAADSLASWRAGLTAASPVGTTSV